MNKYYHCIHLAKNLHFIYLHINFVDILLLLPIHISCRSYNMDWRELHHSENFSLKDMKNRVRLYEF
jgi:hypothetical protein